MSQLSNWGPVAVIVAGYVIGFCFQNGPIDDLRDSIHQRFSIVDARFADLTPASPIRGTTLRPHLRLDRLCGYPIC